MVEASVVMKGRRVYVRLANDWVDRNGVGHGAGDTVEVDYVTLAELEAGGYVSTDEQTQDGWIGPGGPAKASGSGTGTGESDGWPGPGAPPKVADPGTGTEGDSGWPGPGAPPKEGRPEVGTEGEGRPGPEAPDGDAAGTDEELTDGDGNVVKPTGWIGPG